MYYKYLTTNMKERFLLLSLLCALSIPSIAQRWRPLLPGNLHFYQSPINYSIRVDSVGEVNGDSTFWLNDIAGPRPSGCGNQYHFLPGMEGCWGDRFVELPGGIVAFVSRAGDSAVFHTLDAVGSTWAFATNSSLTATLSSRAIANFQGVTDSVITIDISDGRQFQLSEHYGLISGINPGFYLGGGFFLTSVLHELPDVPNFKRYNAWQPGDRWGTSKHVGGASGYYEYHEYRVLSRSLSPQADTLTIVHEDRGLQIWYPPYDTILLPMQTNSTRQTATQLRHLERATWEVTSDNNYYHWQQPWIQAMPGSRMELPFLYGPSTGMVDSCGYTPFTMFPEQTQLPVRFVEGLGMTYRQFITGTGTSGYHYGTFQMDCYAQAAWDSLWPCPGAFILLSAPSPSGSNISMTPWVDASRGLQGIRWEGLISGDYHLELLDMSGRLLWESDSYLESSGNLQLASGLPQGICVLSLSNRDGNTAYAVKIPVLRN